MPADPVTTIQVHASTRRLLESYKVGGRTYDEVLLDLMEQMPSQEFFRAMKEQLRHGRWTPLEEVRKKLSL
jgi:hypothetical protein